MINLILTILIAIVVVLIVVFSALKSSCKNVKEEYGKGGISYNLQPNSSVQLVNNTSEVPLYVYVEYSNKKLDAPPSPWKKINGNGNIGTPTAYESGTSHPPNDVGAGTWQVVTLDKGEWIVLNIPAFPKPQAWSIRPLKYINEKPCTGGAGNCGMPTLIESGKDMIGDMSAVDGVNFLVKYEMSAKDGSTIVDFNTNPCKVIGANPKGCRNPSVNGIFKNLGDKCLPAGSNYCWLSAPCPAGTCNLIKKSKDWCDAVHTGQCANSSSTWSNKQRGTGGPDSCSKHNLFTTYCYSHDDTTSSPLFSDPYKMKITYSDLD